MRLFPANWSGFLEEILRWGELSIEARRAFVDGTAPGLSIDPAVGGAPIDELLDAGFLAPIGRGDLLGVAEEWAGFHQVLKSLGKFPLFDRPGLSSLSAYLGEHYTPAERSQLNESIALLPNDLPRIAGFVSSVEWLQTALGRPQMRGPAVPAGTAGGAAVASAVPSTDAAHALDAARALRDFFTTQRDRVAFRDLEEYLPHVPRDELCAGIRLGVQRCLFYLGVRHADLEPLVGIWPAAARRMRRRAVVLAPEPVAAGQVFRHPFLLEDMTSLLVASRAAPIPLRRGDDKPFARFVEEAAGMLLTLPAWLEAFTGLTLEGRIGLALQALRITGLLGTARGEPGAPAPLVPGPTADSWIRSPLEERRAGVTRILCAAEARPLLFELLEEDWASHGERHEEILPWLQQAFGSVPANGFIRFADFAEYQAAIGSPLAPSGAPGDEQEADGAGFTTEEAMEELWKSFLGIFLGRCLLSLGGAEAGLTADGGDKPAFRVTTDGRRLLGIPTDGAAAGMEREPEDERPFVVQPNFEVVFLSPSPGVEAELGRYCERVGREIGVLFRISRQSLQKAGASGFEPQQLLRLLSQRSRSSLPTNVTHEIQGWMALRG